jgi:hypothetical protein
MPTARLTTANHSDVVALADQLIGHLPVEDQRWMWGGAATEFYGLQLK